MIHLLLLRVEHVRVMLLGLLEELLLDLLLRGVYWHPQDLVVVLINRELKVHGGEPSTGQWHQDHVPLSGTGKQRSMFEEIKHL
jgi:hypothetical protein